MYSLRVSTLNACVTRNSAPVSGGIHRLAIARDDVVVTSLVKPGNTGLRSSHLRAIFSPARRATNSGFHAICKAVPSEKQEEEQETIIKEEISSIAPTTLQVQSLLLDVCDETSIAELKVKVGDFQLHMKRDVSKKSEAPVVPAQPSIASTPVPTMASPAPKSNNSVSLLPATVSKTASLFGLLEAAADQGLSFVTSPKVGIFKRARNTKTKAGKPLVEEGMTIKEGQVVGYLDQLGTQQPIEAQVSGEVVQVLWEDGEPVGYGDPLISIRPSFPGIVSGATLN